MISDSIEDWLTFCRRNHTPATVATYQRITRHLQEAVGDRPAHEVSVSDLERHIDRLIEKGHGRNTINSHLAAIKSFWSWLSARQGIPNIAAQVPRLTPQNPEQRALTEEEYTRVLAICDPIERDIIQWLANTGMRRGEFVRMKIEDVASDGLSIRVPIGKGRKPRVVPLNTICRDIITRTHLAFLQRHGRPSAMNRLCNRLATRAGVAAFGPHALRHLFCTRMFRAGKPAKVISKILGHSSLTITELVYCHLLPADLIGMTEGLS